MNDNGNQDDEDTTIENDPDLRASLEQADQDLADGNVRSLSEILDEMDSPA